MIAHGYHWPEDFGRWYFFVTLEKFSNFPSGKEHSGQDADCELRTGEKWPSGGRVPARETDRPDTEFDGLKGRRMHKQNEIKKKSRRQINAL